MPANIVFIVDDDESVRTALSRLVRSAGLNPIACSSAREFLDSVLPDQPSCLVLDVRLPGLNGLELQQQLSRTERDIPIIFITGHGDVPMSVRAMRAGAVDFLEKPFGDRDLLDAIDRALRMDRETRLQRLRQKRVEGRLARLTAREREVLTLVVEGLPNKIVGARLGITEKTVKVHRARVMQKMEADSLPQLVRLAERVNIP